MTAVIPAAAPDALPDRRAPLRSFLPSDVELDALAADADDTWASLLVTQARWAAELSVRLDELPLAELKALVGGGGPLGMVRALLGSRG